MRKTLFRLQIFSLALLPGVTHAAFADVSANHQFRAGIDYVQSEGIVEGYADGTFKPNAKINRAEFTKIVVGATVTGIAGEGCFPDVDNEWFAPFVCTAKNVGLVGGYPDGTFRPGQNVSFVEAAKIIANAFELEAGAAGNAWYETFVRSLASGNAIPTTIGSFDQEITRGEMAEMIYRLRVGNTDMASQTYESLAGIRTASSSSSSSTATATKTLPYTFEVTADWKSAWNFFIDTAAPEVDPEKGVNHLATLDLDRVNRVEEPGGRFPAFLRILFPEGAGSFFVAHFYEKDRAGVVASATGNMKPSDSMHMRYFVRFPEDFDFGTSGSLPGFSIGTTSSEYGVLGSDTEVGIGWSEKGEIQALGSFKDDMHISRTTLKKFAADGQWHQIDISARLNTVPVRRLNGSLVIEYDGERVYQSGSVELRARSEDIIDSFDLISTIGGRDTFTVAPKDMHLDVTGFTFDTNLTPYQSDAY